MDLLSAFLVPLVRVIDLAVTLYIYVVIARALVSWVNPDPYNPIVRFLHNATEPVLNRIRRWLPVQMGGLDLAPLVLIFGLYFLMEVLKNLVFRVLALGY
jgi:YggT family protein